MKRIRFTILSALLAGGVAVLSACGSGTATPSAGPAGLAAAVDFVNGTAQANNASTDTGDFFSGPRDSEPAKKWTQLTAGSAGDLNPVVLDAKGFVLYRFDNDTAKPSKSNCDGDCAKTWPPVLVEPGSKIFLDGVDRSAVGTVQRSDGSTQVTINGWPAYRYSQDTQPGQASGQGVGGTWFALAPDGTKAGQSEQGTDSQTGLDYKNGTAAANNAPKNAGDLYQGSRSDDAAMQWVELSAGSANGLSPIVHNGAGRTLYRFDKDTPNPSKSNCDGDCAKTWPPVLVKPGSRIFVNGVPTSKIGIVTRSDGTRQVTIGGWPVYLFSGDNGAGQTNGEGVGGTWFAVSPSGGKVQPANGSASSSTSAAPSTSAPSTAPSVQLGNGSVILDSDVNFNESNGSEGVSGPGCQNVRQPNLASSLQLAGGPVKIWTGRDCTGTSAVVTDSVADLSKIGFDKKIMSIRFGDN